jgi:tetratricopeptide (TPR) repeat protein
VLARLTHQCLQDLVSEVAPHERQVRVKLAGGGLAVGSGNLRKGNQAAAEGDWQTARREWEMALRDNPDSHAAHYNLGVAAEVAGDLPAAAAAFREAQRRASKELYGDALARVERATREQQQVFAQRSAVPQLARQPLANEGFQRAGWPFVSGPPGREGDSRGPAASLY